MKKASIVLVLSGLLSACGEQPPPPRFPVTFVAVSDPGVPLAGVTVTANGSPVPGATDAQGLLHVFLTGPEGSPVQIGARCPEGYRQPTALPMLVLRRVVSLDPAARDRGLQVSIACPPLQRHGVVVVRAGGDRPQPNVPVMIDGREVARTDASGAAHVALDMPPGGTFQVVLATAALPQLRPRDPPRTFTFPDHDEIFVFDQPFEVEEAPRPRPRHGGRPVRQQAPQPRLPVKIGPIRR